MPMESYAGPVDAVFRMQGAGGGGVGDPLLREPERVALDVQEGKVTREGARRDYGVAVTADGTLDTASTERLRAGWHGARPTAP